jgi:GH15 family glucan-1,4-alpha-glucosidase
MKSPPGEYSAIIGDSRLLCVLASTGEIRRLFWPNIDYGQHVEQFAIGLQAQGQGNIIWLADRAWNRSQSYVPGANVLVTSAVHKRARISTSSTAFAVPGNDAVVLRFTITNNAARLRDIRLGVYQVLRINESPFYNTALFDESSGSVVFYHRGIAIATRSTAKVAGYQCGVAGEETSSIRDQTGWNLAGASIQHKDPDAAVVWGLGQLGPNEQASMSLYVTAGETITEAISRSDSLGGSDRTPPATAAASVRAADAGLAGSEPSRPVRRDSRDGDRLLESVQNAWKQWLAGCDVAKNADSSAGRRDAEHVLRPNLGTGSVTNRPVRRDGLSKLGSKGRELYDRSLLTLKLLSDRTTGAIIAAAEFDREREACGGYGYVWGRDAAFNAYALGLGGMLEEAEAFFEFARRVQEPDGVWLHRHYSSGQLAPSWGLIQIDETGAILWAAYEHFKMTGSHDFLAMMWDSVSRAANYLAGSIDEETGLPLPSFELWEEQLCQSVYSAAAVTGGLRAAAGLAAALGKDHEARAWNEPADDLRDAIRKTLWDPKSKSFLKSLNRSMSESEFARNAAARRADSYIELAEGRLYPEFIQARDQTIDVSLLGLAFPFRVFDAEDQMMKRGAASVLQKLWSPKAGGIMRYEGDTYVGGNPWILTTLWLAIYYLEAGMTARAVKLIKWAIDHSTDAGLLTEQVDKKTGKPVWAVPLGWSHAMYIIAALKLIQK